MQVKIIAFGQISEITGKELSLVADDITALKSILQNQFPALEKKRYSIAVNQKLVKNNILLNVNDTVALMPPYSGG